MSWAIPNNEIILDSENILDIDCLKLWMIIIDIEWWCILYYKCILYYFILFYCILPLQKKEFEGCKLVEGFQSHLGRQPAVQKASENMFFGLFEIKICSGCQ